MLLAAPQFQAQLGDVALQLGDLGSDRIEPWSMPRIISHIIKPIVIGQTTRRR